MVHPLMPKATAVWLIENTTLTFEQIAAFCGLHPLEISAIADGEAAVGMVGLDPVASGQLTHEEIERGEKNPKAELVLTTPVTAESILGKSRGRYTPVSKRQDRPDAIAWIIRHHPELSDTQICQLLGTTKPTIKAIRTKTHKNTANIKPRNPVQLGLCSQDELDEAISQAKGEAPSA